MLEQIINGTSPLVDIQSERGEYVIFDDYSITPVHAKRSHKAMERAGDEDQVTDSLPDTTFIASDYTKIKRQDAKDMIVGIKRFPYSENKKGREPELWSLDDVIFSKGDKVKTPAAAVKRVQSKFKVKGTDEHPAIMITDEENRQHRAPYLEGIALLAENQREREETIEDMGSVEFIPYFKRGGKVYRNNVDQAFFGKIVKGIGKGLGAVGKAVGKGVGAVAKGVKDVGLFGVDNFTNLAFGADLIKDGAFSYGISKDLSNFTGNALNKVGDFAVPLAATAFLGPAGAATVSGLRGTTNSLADGNNILKALGAGALGAGASFAGAKALGNTGGFGNISGNANRLFANSSGLLGKAKAIGNVQKDLKNPLSGIKGIGQIANINPNQLNQGLGFLQNLYNKQGAQTQGIAGGVGSIGQLAGLFGQFGNLLNGVDLNGRQLGGPAKMQNGGQNFSAEELALLFQVINPLPTNGGILPNLPNPIDPLQVPTYIPQIPGTVAPNSGFPVTGVGGPSSDVNGNTVLQDGTIIPGQPGGTNININNGTGRGAIGFLGTDTGASLLQGATLATLLANTGVDIANLNRTRGAFDDVEGFNNNFIEQSQANLDRFGQTSSAGITDFLNTARGNNIASVGTGLLNSALLQGPAQEVATSFSNQLNSIDQARSRFQNQTRGQQLSPTLLKALGPQQQLLAIGQNIASNNANASSINGQLASLDLQQGRLLDNQLNANNTTNTNNQNNLATTSNTRVNGITSSLINGINADTGIAQQQLNLEQALANTLFQGQGGIDADALNLFSNTTLSRANAVNNALSTIPQNVLQGLGPLLSLGNFANIRTA